MRLFLAASGSVELAQIPTLNRTRLFKDGVLQWNREEFIMSLLPWARAHASGLPPMPAPVTDPSHHLRATISSTLAHIPHSLPEPHTHYPPLHPSYLESARLSREMKHL
jgi:hypothetical protein